MQEKLLKWPTAGCNKNEIGEMQQQQTTSGSICGCSTQRTRQRFVHPHGRRTDVASGMSIKKNILKMVPSKTDSSRASARTVQHKLSIGEQTKTEESGVATIRGALQSQTMFWCCGCVGRRHQKAVDRAVPLAGGCTYVVNHPVSIARNHKRHATRQQ
jgi:hypothetical protein